MLFRAVAGVVYRTCVKSHKIFLPIRDLRDSAISAIKRGLIDNNPESIKHFIKRNINMYNVWNKYTSYVFVYEKYMNDKERVIKEIRNER